jgi:hypothetical protein
LNCVREDPVRKGLLYACAEKGVYVSFDDGDDWQALQLNLPVTSVRDLVVREDDLVIATFGRSFWVLDDVAPLRQIDARAAAADVWLFKPGTAYRVRQGSDQSTPVPDDEALAANAPNGAVLDYYLKEKSTGPIQLEIFDSDGRLVRRLASDDEIPKVNPNDLAFPVSWAREPQPLSNEAGMHRFVWDLRYQQPKGVRRSFRRAAGPVALPGNYTVRLTAHGKNSTQPLMVKMDPRVKTPQEALVRQFELASKLTARQGEISAAMQQIGELRKQIEARKKEAGEKAEAVKALEEVNQKLDALTETEGEGGFGLYGLALPGKEHEGLPKVASALSGLAAIVESGDVAPTTDANTASEKWDKAAEEALARWTAFQRNELASANGVLQKAALKPLVIGEAEAAH